MIAMGLSGGSLFKTSSKCSFHPSTRLSSSVMTLLSLSLISGLLWRLHVIADVLGDSIQGLHMSVISGLLSHAHLVLQPYPVIRSNT